MKEHYHHVDGVIVEQSRPGIRGKGEINVSKRAVRSLYMFSLIFCSVCSAYVVPGLEWHKGAVAQKQFDAG